MFKQNALKPEQLTRFSSQGASSRPKRGASLLNHLKARYFGRKGSRSGGSEDSEEIFIVLYPHEYSSGDPATSLQGAAKLFLVQVGSATVSNLEKVP